MKIEHPEQDFTLLSSGRAEPFDASVEYLFELASQLAVAGRYGDKNRIYEQWILDHPRALPDDRARVLINRHDQLRRKGQAAEALAGLQAMETPQESVVIREWLQAVANCHLALGDLTGAISAQRWLISTLDEEVPDDKRVYFLEMLVHLLLLAGQADEEVEERLIQLDTLTRSDRLSGAMKQRAGESYLRLQGRYLAASGAFAEALEPLDRAYVGATVVREKVVTGLIYLYCASQCGQIRSPESMEVWQYCRENLGALQETDKIGYRQYWQNFLGLLEAAGAI
ncbi:MAG: hypothetical protein HY397_01760 [Candidatus Doudnabacteria bacterium]|nr:hypothetical protein [Candidatus Doudnabacteria bacterium]